jgi:hypothetical protein
LSEIPRRFDLSAIFNKSKRDVIINWSLCIKRFAERLYACWEAAMLQKFLIERETIGLDIFTPEELADLVDMSNEVLAEMVGIQWQCSFVGGDRTYSIFLAESEADLREHSRLAGLPITRIVPIRGLADPSFATGTHPGIVVVQPGDVPRDDAPHEGHSGPTER